MSTSTSTTLSHFCKCKVTVGKTRQQRKTIEKSDIDRISHTVWKIKLLLTCWEIVQVAINFVWAFRKLRMTRHFSKKKSLEVVFFSKIAKKNPMVQLTGAFNLFCGKCVIIAWVLVISINIAFWHERWTEKQISLLEICRKYANV